MTDAPHMTVTATPAALALIGDLKTRFGNELLFHQSGGCCDGSAPMCFQKGDYITGDQDVLVGEIGGVPFYMNADQYARWQHTDLVIDAIDGIGGMFSLENGSGRRFLTRSDVCIR
ncbi:DUF779 domain-containing protein [Seohaeicola saemankumensis]|nr:DUF779 domain-containing protein [Seohaeicola saemankumensis]MCA0870782.1 DUF779 domain-containing protein [Seohaeicola saemankumensis]